MVDLRRHAPLVLGVVLALGGQAEVFLADVWRGPAVADAAAAAAPLLLAWIRTRPVVAACALLALYAADALAFGSPASVTQYFACSAAVFWTAASVARHRWVVAAAAVVVLLVIQLRDPEELSPGSYVFPFVFLGAAWAIGLVVRNREQLATAERERAERLQAEQVAVARAAVLDERVRIARELHDVVAHGLSGIVVQAVAARTVLRTSPDVAEASLDAIETTGQQAMTEMRRLLGVLRRVEELPLLVPQPGLAQLEALIDNARRAGLSVDLTIDGRRRDLPDGVDLSAYRIVQEALTNVIKHARGERASVCVTFGERAVDLGIVNDGPAATADDRGGAGGHGIVGMRERAALYGGELRAGPRDGGGYEVRARLPLAA